MKTLTQEQVEMIQRRIDDPDWDISQQNDVYEVLPLFLEMKEEFDDAHAERIKVLNEECAPDELHCVCVPTLRAEITKLRADLAAAVDILRSVKYDLESDGLTYYVTNGVRHENDRYVKICDVLARFDATGGGGQ